MHYTRHLEKLLARVHPKAPPRNEATHQGAKKKVSQPGELRAFNGILMFIWSNSHTPGAVPRRRGDCALLAAKSRGSLVRIKHSVMPSPPPQQQRRKYTRFPRIYIGISLLAAAAASLYFRCMGLPGPIFGREIYMAGWPRRGVTWLPRAHLASILDKVNVLVACATAVFESFALYTCALSYTRTLPYRYIYTRYCRRIYLPAI